MADFDSSLQSGTLLNNGTYRIERVIGRGGFGITYLAVNTTLNSIVAIKEFFPKGMVNRDYDTTGVSVASYESVELIDKLKTKFIKEARRIASLNHESIVRVTTAFEENGTAYYVMDFIEGYDLQGFIRRVGPLPIDVAVRYVTQVGKALDYLHSRRINHLDVKPANILIDPKTDRAILIDFGLSKQYDNGGHQTSTTPVGISEGYAPIEQYTWGGVQEFSASTDVYSLGATLYCLLTGERPPSANDLVEMDLQFPVNVPYYLRAAICRAMSTRRADRYRSIDEFLNAICTEETTQEASYRHEAYDDDDEDDYAIVGSQKWWKRTIVAVPLMFVILVFIVFMSLFKWEYVLSALLGCNVKIGIIIIDVIILAAGVIPAIFAHKRGKFFLFGCFLFTGLFGALLYPIMTFSYLPSNKDISYENGVGISLGNYYSDGGIYECMDLWDNKGEHIHQFTSNGEIRYQTNPDGSVDILYYSELNDEGKKTVNYVNVDNTDLHNITEGQTIFLSPVDAQRAFDALWYNYNNTGQFNMKVLRDIVPEPMQEHAIKLTNDFIELINTRENTINKQRKNKEITEEDADAYIIADWGYYGVPYILEIDSLVKSMNTNFPDVTVSDEYLRALKQLDSVKKQLQEYEFYIPEH